MAKRRHSSGKEAFFICDRSGFKYPYKEGVLEPGTNLFVHYTETDGKWNLVDHPQNKAPKNMEDSSALKNARPDIESSVSVNTSSIAGTFGITS